MKAIPTDEECGLRVRSYFAHHNHWPGWPSPKWAVEKMFFEDPKFQPSDWDRGLHYALAKRWLTRYGETLMLTEFGFAEMRALIGGSVPP